MPIVLPESAKQVSQKAKIDVKRSLVTSEPFLARSYLGSIISGVCNRIYEFYQALRDAELEANPATAIRNLVSWANIWSVNRLAGSAAQGQMFLNSTSGGTGTLVPNGTIFVSSDGTLYTSSADATLVAFSALAITSITRSGTTATVTTTVAHNLASNAILTISGAVEAGYNLTDVVITVLSATTFTYEVDAATTTPATGSPVYAGAGIQINVVADEVGDDFNLLADAALSFQTPLPSVEASGLVTFPAVVDGIDVESDTDLRARLLDRIQNPVTPFNVANITAVAREIVGVTRVFVDESTPAIGQVTMRFMRDNDVDPIPSAADVTQVKTAVLAIKPAHTADADVFVSAPVAVPTNFTFSALSPDTTSMRAAITSQLTDFFKRNTTVGVSVSEDAFRAAIFNTIDPVSGQQVASFTLTLPTMTINAQDETSYGDIPTSEGIFVGGTGHAVADVITLSNGVTITVDVAFSVFGVVTQFTVGSGDDQGSISGTTYSQESTTGSGVDFSLTPDVDNVQLSTVLNVAVGEIRTLGTVVFA